ncbi:MAG TPA: acyl-CoA dehydrogenase [Rhizobium sp.]
MTETNAAKKVVSAKPDLAALPALFAEIGRSAASREANREHPFAELDLLRRARFGALRVAVRHGGAGISLRELLEQVIALADADPNVAHILRNHFNFVERYAIDPDDPAQRKFNADVVEGAIFSVANTEIGNPNRGPRDYDTLLVPDGDGFRLTGRKYYTTGCYYADYIAVRSRLPNGENASAIIPGNREGVDRLDDWNGMGQRLTGSGTTVLENVRIEPNEVVPDRAGANYKRPYSSTLSQLFLTTVIAGILRSVLRDATALLAKRQQVYYYAPTRTPVEDPILQTAIGQIAANAFAAEAAVLAAGEALDRAVAARGNPDLAKQAAHEGAIAAAKAKIVVDDVALKTTTLLFDVGGASATVQETNLHRHWRNVRTIASHNPASYKAWLVGTHLLNGTCLPTEGFF